MTAKPSGYIMGAFARQNARKREALAEGAAGPVATQPWLYSYALRQPAFTWGGHSLGFFEYYRHSDNAMCYETSNRDYRVWHWESYLNDVGRSIGRFLGKPFGVYVKPHRGAPAQRALSAAARGCRMIYWYTYGPEWHMGDSFGGSKELRHTVGWANRLLAKAEEVVVGAEWAVAPEVAVVRPRTAEFHGSACDWRTGRFSATPEGNAGWENGKWVYSALMAAHIPVDALDEPLLRELDLSRYRVIYVSGSHIRRDVADVLKAWVKQGGVLHTSGWGLAEDEARQPLETLYPVFGVSSRSKPEIWGRVTRYGATGLRPITPMAEPPESATLSGSSLLEGSFTPAVGREVLHPTDTDTVLATWADGRAAAIRNRFGKGRAWLVGTFAGLEYAVDMMAGRRPRADKRSWVTALARTADVEPVVDAAAPLVEGILLRNAAQKKRAIVLMNWDYRDRRTLSTFTNLTVTVRAASPGKQLRSLALDQELAFTEEAGRLRFQLPELREGDILVLED